MLIWLLLFCVASVSVVMGQGGSAQDPFSIVIRAPKTVVRAGMPVEIRIRMTNRSDREIVPLAFYSLGADIAYKYEVRDKSGKHVANKTIFHPIYASGFDRSLKRGESADEESSLVSDVRDMSAPGQYTIQVSRTVSENPKDGIVRSNTITVTVTPLQPRQPRVDKVVVSTKDAPRSGT
jgi:hypothetical protein